MAKLILNFCAQFGKCLLVSVGDKQRIITKTLVSTCRPGNVTFAYALKEMSLGRVISAYYFVSAI